MLVFLPPTTTDPTAPVNGQQQPPTSPPSPAVVVRPTHPPIHPKPTAAHSNRLVLLHPTHPPTHPLTLPIQASTLFRVFSVALHSVAKFNENEAFLRPHLRRLVLLSQRYALRYVPPTHPPTHLRRLVLLSQRYALWYVPPTQPSYSRTRVQQQLMQTTQPPTHPPTH